MKNKVDKLIKAIQKEDINLIEELFRQDNAIFRYPLAIDSYAVHYAAQLGRIRVLHAITFLDSSQLNAINIADEVPLEIAENYGHYECMEVLIQRGALDDFLAIKFIHQAAMKGRIEALKIYLSYYPGLINERNNQHETALSLAAQYNQEEVVSFLLKVDADLMITPHESVLDRMRKIQNTAMVNLILQHLAQTSPSNLVIYIKTAQEALHLMVSEPTIAMDLLKDPIISHLIKNEKSCVIEKNKIFWYRQSYGTRHSFYASINQDNGQREVFKPNKILGQGTYGFVRSFQNEHHEVLAVKALNETSHHYKVDKERMERETKFAEKASKSHGDFQLFNFKRKAMGNPLYSPRLVMPLVKGLPSHLIINEMDSVKEFAQLFIKMGKELKRVHKLALVHGDVSTANFIVHIDKKNQINVQLIDFGMAGIQDVDKALIFSKYSELLAPERIGVKKAPLANTKQDVFSFGVTLNDLLNRIATRNELDKHFPYLATFIRRASNKNPEKRPSIHYFCKKMEEEYNNYKCIEDNETIQLK